MSQPPYDEKLAPFYLLHYTYGMDYTLQGEFTPGACPLGGPLPAAAAVAADTPLPDCSAALAAATRCCAAADAPMPRPLDQASMASGGSTSAATLATLRRATLESRRLA